MMDETPSRGRVRLDIDGPIATLTIDRPDRLNTFTVEMARELTGHCESLERDASVRVAIITGAGDRAFSAGSDIGLLEELGDNWQARNRRAFGVDYVAPLLALRKPLVAAIRGYCIGGGLEIVIASDVRVAAASASFGAGEIRLGWHAGSGNTTILPRLIGYGNAARWILTGDRFPAVEAHRVGLVQEVVDDEDLDSTVRALAERIAVNPPIAVESAKHLIRMSQGTTVDQGLAWENDMYSYCMTTEDSREGIAAFAGKRAPRYRGR